MSGGHFEYNQYRVREIAEDIERLIANNDDETKNEWGERKGYGFSPDIIERFKEAAHTLYQAADMTQRVDWLVSGDDGEGSFFARWEKEVRPYWGATKTEFKYRNGEKAKVLVWDRPNTQFCILTMRNDGTIVHHLNDGTVRLGEDSGDSEWDLILTKND